MTSSYDCPLHCIMPQRRRWVMTAWIPRAGEIECHRPHPIRADTDPTTSGPWLNLGPGSLNSTGWSLHSIAANNNDVMAWKRFPHYRPFEWVSHRLPVDSFKGGGGKTDLYSVFIVRGNTPLYKHRNAGDLRRQTLKWRNCSLAKMTLEECRFMTWIYHECNPLIW